MLLQLAVILRIRTEVNEVTNVVATWRHQTKKFTSPTCPSLLSCSSSFILTFLAMEFLPQRSSQRSYQSLCNLSTETTHNGHVKEQDFGPLTSGPTRGVKRWSWEGYSGHLGTPQRSDFDLARVGEVKRS